MGVYDVTSSAGYPGLRIVIIWETFHWVGK